MNHASFRFKNQLVTTFFCSLLAITASTLSSSPNSLQIPIFTTPTFCPLAKESKIVIIIPAYNEEQRISKTLLAYFEYFKVCQNVNVTFLVVCNNCSDKTVEICKDMQKEHSELQLMDLKPGGKGFAIKQGFLKALDFEDADYIGFVDADMATSPPYFYELITNIQGYDGAIASRYKQGARVWPNRPFVKKVGGKFYNWVLRHRFHLDVLDTQCGAKLFTYDTIKKAVPHMEEIGWAWDLEFLYLCQLFNKNIVEVPTTWIDAPGSHLTISGCYQEFISAPSRIKKQQQKLAKEVTLEKNKAKRAARKQKKQKHCHSKSKK